MDSTNQNQTAQMVAWLDEERRKDKALIIRLEERIASQAVYIEEQSRRLHAMEGQFTSMKAGYIATGTFEETISRLRADVVALIEQSETRRSDNRDDLRRMREIDRDALMRAIEETRQEFALRIERELLPRRTEEERLSRVALELQAYADNLKRGLEEFERSLAFLDEQRRQDSRRISELDGEADELGKRLDMNIPKVELLEELARRNERATADLGAAIQEMRQQQQEWTEREAMAAQKREQTMHEISRRADGFLADVDNFKKQFDLWAETHRAMRKDIDDFDRLAERVERRLNEIVGMQKINEDRFRSEWEEYKKDDQKRWRQFTVTNDETWRDHDKQMAEISAEIAKLTDRLVKLGDAMRSIRTVQQDFLAGLGDFMQTMQERSEAEVRTQQPNA